MAGARGPIIGALTAMLVIAGALALVARPSASSAARARCERASGKTIAAGGRVRVLASGGVLYACAMRSGRMFELGNEEPDPCAPEDCDAIAIVDTEVAGRFVAYAEADFDKYGGTVDLYLLDTDLARRRRVSTEANTNVASLDGLVLTPRGGMAWLVPEGSGTRRVFKADAGGRRELLDERRGADIVPGSLALSDSQRTVYWTNAGVPRSAPIR